MKPLLFTVGRFACTSSYIARSTTATIGRNYSRSTFALGFEEFYDKPLQKGEVFIAGREWSAADLRRKVIPFRIVFYCCLCFAILNSRALTICISYGMFCTKREIYC